MIDFNIKSMKLSATENPPFFLQRPKGVDNYLLLLFKSHGELTVKNKIFKYAPRDLIVLQPGTPHAINTLDSILVHDWMHFTVPDNESFSSSGIVFDKLLPCPYANLISDSLRRVQEEYTRQYNDKTVIDYLLNTLIVYVLRSYSIGKKLSSNDRKMMDKFDELRNDLYADCNKYSSLEQMSAALYLSQSRFCHLYKKFYHVSPLQDLINIRIQTAKQLLLTTEDKMKDIAQKCGFANEFSFIRCFKNRTGQTPYRWKQ